METQRVAYCSCCPPAEDIASKQQKNFPRCCLFFFTSPTCFSVTGGTVRPLRCRYRKPTDARSGLPCLNMNMAFVTLFYLSPVCSNDSEVSLRKHRHRPSSVCLQLTPLDVRMMRFKTRTSQTTSTLSKSTPTFSPTHLYSPHICLSAADA